MKTGEPPRLRVIQGSGRKRRVSRGDRIVVSLATIIVVAWLAFLAYVAVQLVS